MYIPFDGLNYMFTHFFFFFPPDKQFLMELTTLMNKDEDRYSSSENFTCMSILASLLGKVVSDSKHASLKGTGGSKFNCTYMPSN